VHASAYCIHHYFTRNHISHAAAKNAAHVQNMCPLPAPKEIEMGLCRKPSSNNRKREGWGLLLHLNRLAGRGHETAALLHDCDAPLVAVYRGDWRVVAGQRDGVIPCAHILESLASPKISRTSNAITVVQH
jgi:hypothetical protein